MALAMTAYLSDSQEIPAREIRLFERMCDASAIEALDDTTFVVANDEDNVLRVYDWTRPGPPIRELNLNRFLPPMQGRGELDLEGVARINDELYWISSHGRNASGEPAPRRQALLRTPRSWFLGSAPSGGSVAVCTGLLEALFADPRYAALGLAEAAQRPPKAAGGLNIEALAAGPNGSLWIGFRNPLFEGRALMVSLLNPHSAVAGDPPRFGDPVLLDMGGRGLRGALEWGSGYLLLAGSTHGARSPALFYWSGNAKEPPRRLAGYDFAGLNPEGLTRWPGIQPPQLWIVSDDGAETIHGRACKDAPARERRFRVLAVPAPNLQTRGGQE
jgi:hypothetical protein